MAHTKVQRVAEGSRPHAPSSSSAVPAAPQREVDQQVHCLQQDLAKLKMQMQQKDFDLLAAQDQLKQKEKEQQKIYVRQDFDAPRSHAADRQQQQQMQLLQDDEGWYVKTSKKRSPVKVGGQYVMPQPLVPHPPPSYHQVASEVARQPEVNFQLPQSEAMDIFFLSLIHI